MEALEKPCTAPIITTSCEADRNYLIARGRAAFSGFYAIEYQALLGCQLGQFDNPLVELTGRLQGNIRSGQVVLSITPANIRPSKGFLQLRNLLLFGAQFGCQCCIGMPLSQQGTYLQQVRTRGQAEQD